MTPDLSPAAESTLPTHQIASPRQIPRDRQAWEWIWLIALLAFSLITRLVCLDRAPPGVRFDELVNVKMADHIYAGEWPIYFQEAWGHEPLYHYFHAAGMSLLGKTVLGVRITSILFGVLGVYATYLAFRPLFGPGVALTSATLLSFSLWSLMYSRIGLRHISLPPWIGLSIYCFWRGLQAPLAEPGKNRLWFALGGVSLGIMLYTYFASRVVPFVFAGFVLYLVLFYRHLLHRRWIGLVLFFGLPALIVAPMVAYLGRHPELEQRLGQVGAEILGALRVGDLGPLLKSVGRTLLMFSFKGDREWLYNISGRPVFDPVTAIAFYGGLFLAFWRWREPKRAFVLLWLALGIAPAMLSWPPGSLGHTIAAQPVAFVFPALLLVALWQQAKTLRWARWPARVLVVVAIAWFGTINFWDYFVRWPQYPDVRHEYQASTTAIARYLEQVDAGKKQDSIIGDVPLPAAVSAPYVDYWNPWSKRNFDLFYDRRGATGEDGAAVRWFNGKSSILFPGGTSEMQAVLFFVPDHIRLSPTFDPDLHNLLASGAEHLETGFVDVRGATFDLYRWQGQESLARRLQAVASSPTWTSPEAAYVAGQSEQERQEQRTPTDFAGRLLLLGYTYNQGLLSSERSPFSGHNTSGGDTLRVDTYWRVQDAASDPLAVFVHLLDDANAVLAGWDGLHVSTESWRSGDVFIQVHELRIPDSVPSGVYRLELGVYSPITQQRLDIRTGYGDKVAPHGRLLLLPVQVQ